MSNRLMLPLLMVVGAMVTVAAVVQQGQLEPADFTFNNGAEIKSFDPAVLTDNASGRIAWALYEGLVRPSPVDRSPLPGMAQRWEISDDGLTYTFHLREGAVWSNGDPIVAADFVYSMRRFLDLRTKAEYAYQAWYLKNARRYSQAARGVEPGDPVEIELHERPAGGLPFARGKLLRGKLLRVDQDADATEEQLADEAQYVLHRAFVVDINGEPTTFRIDYDNAPPAGTNEARYCKQLALDFREVGIRAIDPATVEMVLKAPTPYWLQLTGFYPLSPVNQRCVETFGPREWQRPQNIVTNGAYQLVFRRLRDRIRLRKNPNYWNAENVSIDTIDVLAVESLTTAFNLFETGQIDWTEKIPPLIAKELMKADPPRDDFNPSPYLGTYFYNFNTRRKPFDDPRVRKALALALDRREIVETVLSSERPTRSLTPPGVPGYEPPLCDQENLARAKQLLAEAGFAGGVGFPKFEILYNTNESHKLIAELIRKQWRRGLGLDVATRNEEWTTSLVSLRQGKYEVARRAWIGDYVDPNTFLDMFVTDGENNNTGWGNAEYDQLIADSGDVSDPAKRLAMLHRAERILMDELPIMPIYNYVSGNLVRKSVRGFYNNLQDAHPLWALSLTPDAGGPNKFLSAPPTNRGPE